MISIRADAYRLRLPSEVKTYELKGVAKAGPFYSIDDFEDILTTANEVEYHEIDEIPHLGRHRKD